VNTDIRVSVTWRSHPKRLRLRQTLGPEGCEALLDLWLFAGVNRPDGRLDAMRHLDIAREAGWTGDPDAFVDVLLNLGLLERDAAGELRIHDWTDHNAFAANAAARAAAARKANAVRWSCPIRSRSDLDPNRTQAGPKADHPPSNPNPNLEEKIPPMAPPQGGTAPEKGPEAPQPRRPRSKPRAAQTGRWAEEIAEAIRLWHAAEKAHGQTWKLGGAVEECLARYLERAGSAEKALAALRRLADHPPRQWYLDGPWSLAWLAKSTDSNRQPVDRFHDLLDGRLDADQGQGAIVGQVATAQAKIREFLKGAR